MLLSLPACVQDVAVKCVSPLLLGPGMAGEQGAEGQDEGGLSLPNEAVRESGATARPRMAPLHGWGMDTEGASVSSITACMAACCLAG